MKVFKIRKAFDLYNARIRRKNLEKGINEFSGTMTQKELGSILYPESSEDSISFNMSKLMSKKKDPISVKVEMVKKMCHVLEVDENFLFGRESKFDKDYTKYFGDGK